MPSNWSRRAFVGSAAAAGLLGPGRAQAKKLDGAPNILFILVDQLRAHALSLYGEKNIETPVFDDLLSSGAHFSHSYSANPVCAPARAALISGQFAHRTGVTKNGVQLPLKTKTLSGALSKAGYATGYIGKWHLDATADRPGFVPKSRRFDHQYWAAYNVSHYYRKSGYYLDTDELRRPSPPDRWEPEYQVDQAVEFMGRNRAKPFYLMVSFGPPHPPGAGDDHPWQEHLPDGYWDQINPDALKFRGNVPAELTGRGGAAIEHMRGYYASILALENSIARMMKGVPPNTLVVITADHGEMGGSHGAFKKGSPHEEAVRVPLGFSWQGKISENLKVSTLASGVDVMPTVLGLAGVKAPGGLHGEDLSDWVLGDEGPDRDVILIQGRMERQDAWRMVRSRTHIWSESLDGRRQQLYDLREDPFQMDNLAGKEKSSELRADLESKMASIRKRFKDKRTPSKSDPKGQPDNDEA